MFTNLKTHGGDFRDILETEFSTASSVYVASGYASLDLLQAFKTSFLNIASTGGVAKLLLGMAFYEGLSQKKLEAANNLHSELRALNQNSGVYVANGRRYHGKVYSFINEKHSNVYVGSSNFSFSGTKGNIECTVSIENEFQKARVVRFLNDLYSDAYSIPIDRAEIMVPGKKKVLQSEVEHDWNSLKKHDPKKINFINSPCIELNLASVVKKEKSGLNVYFGKGRENKKTGKIIPRPWYEIELIAGNSINSQDIYPKGDFLAYTDDGYIIPMRTQGDYYKNIRSKKSLQIFGIWLKGKLEKSGCLKKFQPVTQDTLEEYGNTVLRLYKLKKDIYYMCF